ncbi:MAG: hypothetical protein WCI43_09485, partial [Candidatus Firestonebacteria bacterium]
GAREKDILLQFPDGLKPYALEICDFLQEKNKNTEKHKDRKDRKREKYKTKIQTKTKTKC